LGGLLFNRRDWPGFQPSSTDVDAMFEGTLVEAVERGMAFEVEAADDGKYPAIYGSAQWEISRG
jgi:hypothetical protein